MDIPLLGSAIGLMIFSVFVLTSATQGDIPGSPLYFVLRQALYGAIGIALMFVVARIDYSRYREIRVGIYSAMIATITLVLLTGAAARGSRRWIELPYFRFQPSELAKLLLIVALAAFVVDRMRRADTGLKQTFSLAGVGLAPAALVFLQPDLGTGIVLAVITLAVLFVAGVSWRHFAVMGSVATVVIAAVLVVAPAAGVSVLHSYQQERLTSFLHPGDSNGTAYQQQQAKIALGAGGETGRGAQATQTELKFLPERHTDFVFAVIGEHFGFLGAAFVWRALRILTYSKNFYGTLIAGGIASMLMFQVFVNVGMNLGVMPVTGITLPLMSYGGSSVLVTFMAIGVLQSIHIQARLARRDSAVIAPLR